VADARDADCREPPAPRDFKNRDPGVQLVVELLEAAEFAVAYHWIRLIFRRGGQRFAYVYCAGWFAVLVSSLATSRWWSGSGWAAIPLVFATLRIFDIGRWWTDFLVDRRHHLVVSRERNLLFLALNLVEVAVIGAIFFRATSVSPTSIRAFSDAFFEVTQLNFPVAQTHAIALLVKIVVEATSLVLLLGGLAALLDLISGKITEGEWQGDKLAWPWRRPRKFAKKFPSPWKHTD
jgi:hypothetical protein